MIRSHKAWIAAVAACAVVLLCCTPVHSAAVPAIAFFDVNGSRILSSTETDATTSFGWRSIFTSRFGPRPTVSVTTLTVSTPSSQQGNSNNTFDFLSVPYCVNAGGDASATCDLRSSLLYLLVRFRRQEEKHFQALVWQDAMPTSNTLKAWEAFKAAQNRSDVLFPSGNSGMRMEDAAACSDITDECYLASAATYTQSYKELDPSQFSARFLFRLGERYALNAPWRVRLVHTLPHDAETEVEVVMVLGHTPSVNVLDLRWWAETVGGRFTLMLLSIIASFGFLAVTREAGALLARHRPSGGEARTSSALYNEELTGDSFDFLHRVAIVTTACVQKCTARAGSRLQRWRERSTWASTPSWWRSWWDQRRRRLPTSDDAATEADREITAVPPSSAAVASSAATATVDAEEDEEEAGPICRICRCREPFDDLFAPCACNGSSKYVHHHCLEQWREMTTNPEHRRVCAECKTPYTLVRVLVPQNPDLVTSSPILEPVIRHYSTKAVRVAVSVAFAVGGAYCLKAAFFLTTVCDSKVNWSFTHGYHWVLTAYFLIALALNLSIMHPFVKDMEQAELQLLFVFASLVLIEIPISYGMSAFLSLFFDRLFTWEISYGIGVSTTALLHFMDAFTGFCEVVDSFSEERELVAPRATAETEQPPPPPPPQPQPQQQPPV